MQANLMVRTALQNGRTELLDCAFTAPYKIAKPFYEGTSMRLMVMGATPGLLDGDTLSWQVEAGPGTQTTPSQGRPCHPHAPDRPVLYKGVLQHRRRRFPAHPPAGGGGRTALLSAAAGDPLCGQRISKRLRGGPRAGQCIRLFGHHCGWSPGHGRAVPDGALLHPHRDTCGGETRLFG